MELHPLRYLYHEGDRVFIGADEYEVLAFNENAVSLQNVEFPAVRQRVQQGGF